MLFDFLEGHDVFAEAEQDHAEVLEIVEGGVVGDGVLELEDARGEFLGVTAVEALECRDDLIQIHLFLAN